MCFNVEQIGGLKMTHRPNCAMSSTKLCHVIVAHQEKNEWDFNIITAPLTQP